MSSPRAFLLQAIKSEAKLVRGGVYFVKRGVIDWSTFPFAERPRAIAVLSDDCSVLKSTGINDMTLSLEMATSMPTGSEPEIDDGILDELFQDAETLLRKAAERIDSNGDPAAIVLMTESARVVEFHDSRLRVQGIVLTLTASY